MLTGGALSALTTPMGLGRTTADFTYDRQVRNPYTTAGLPRVTPFSQPRPWDAPADQSPDTLAGRLIAQAHPFGFAGLGKAAGAGAALASSPPVAAPFFPGAPARTPFSFAGLGAAGALRAPDVAGGRNIGMMERAPVNFANADDAPQYTPAQLRDQKAAQGFGTFLSGIGSLFSPFVGSQPAQASIPQLKTGVSAAYGPFPSMAPINRPAPPTITPQRFQEMFAPPASAPRYAPMGYTSIPQDVTYRVASAAPVASPYVPTSASDLARAGMTSGVNFSPYRAAPASPLGLAGGAMSTYSYNPLSSATLAKPAATAVPGVTFAAPAPATVPSSKLAPSEFGSPAALSLAGGAAGAMVPTRLGASLAQGGAFGVGTPIQTTQPKPSPMARVAKVAVPMAASAALGPIGGLLARGIMNLATGAPLAQRVGQAISYANAMPRSNPYAASPFTPAGFTAPNYNPVSGGSTYAYRTTAPGVGSYVNSAGRTISYNVNDHS
jgi:hypothetical protein